MAITSNGMAVSENAKFANEQFEYWKENGFFMERGTGDQGSGMAAVFKTYNAMKRSMTDSQIAALRARLTDYLLVAPKEGIVLRADGQVGDIPVTTDVLFWVGQPKPLQVIADVNEEDIAKVMVGQTALLRNDGFPNGALRATVSSITPKGDPLTKTFRAYLALPEESPLRIGMSVEANIIIREKRAVLLVPAEAIRNAGGKASVFTVENGKLKQVPVETGIRGSRLVEVTSGSSFEDDAAEAPVTEPGDDRIVSYRIAGPLFFGSTPRFGDVMSRIGIRPRVYLLDLAAVPLVAAEAGAGIGNLINRAAGREG
jgi:multidrug efflux pump subunit AcrA (membrane-fusion protein)